MALRIESRLRKAEKLARRVRDPDRPTCVVVDEHTFRMKRMYFMGRVGRPVRRDVDMPLPKGLRCKIYIKMDVAELV